MKFIPTTATAVEKIKYRAKVISREESISHVVALERVSVAAGYDGWHHVQQCLAQQKVGIPDIELEPAERKRLPGHIPRAFMDYLAKCERGPKISLPLKGDVFHDVTIERIRFQGWIAKDGNPCILRKSDRDLSEERYVQLGVASIHHCRLTPKSSGKAWWICKYGPEEPRLDLSTMTVQGRHAVAYEFGLPLDLNERETSAADLVGFVGLKQYALYMFYMSPAFESLCLWAKAHPRKIQSYKAGNSYLGRWGEAAINGKSPIAEHEH